MLVFVHVPGGRVVTAKGNAAGLAGAQVHPAAAVLYALGAFILFYGFNFFYAFKVLAK
jgi:hypothetical protein